MTTKNLFDAFPYMENNRIEIKRIEDSDAELLQKLVCSENVYRYLPTFLFEKQYADMHEAIRRSYDCFTAKESVLMGVYIKGVHNLFCGIAEIYHYDEARHKATIGYRLAEEFWGKGIATEVVKLLIQYLFSKTDIEMLAASNIVENPASGKVLEKNGFVKTQATVEEDWGFAHKAVVDKWCCKKAVTGERTEFYE